MSLYITSLNSGSNGNCYYIGNDEEAVLIDAGISCRETEKRMLQLGLSMKRVKAIFISHEHGDHIKGVPGIASKWSIPIYLTDGTYKGCSFHLLTTQLRTFKTGDTVRIGALSIKAFSKLHDASEPQSFVVSYNNTNVGVFTDIGAPCSGLLQHFKECNAAFLEANYDEELLQNGHYPYHLKKRISGGRGHLSNKQALDCFKQHKADHLQCLILSHLSKENNCPNLVKELFKPHAGTTEILVASRYEPLPIYTVTTTLPSLSYVNQSSSLRSQQMSLFE